MHSWKPQVNKGRSHLQSSFCLRFIVALLMQYKFRCVNLIGWSWRTWKINQTRPTYPCALFFHHDELIWSFQLSFIYSTHMRKWQASYPPVASYSSRRSFNMQPFPSIVFNPHLHERPSFSLWMALDGKFHQKEGARKITINIIVFIMRFLSNGVDPIPIWICLSLNICDLR